MPRIFLAADFTPETFEVIKKWQFDYLGYDCLRLVPVENLHSTLMFLGEVGDEEIKELKKVNEVTLNEFGLKPIKVKFNAIKPGPIISNPRLVWIEGESSDLEKYKSLLDSNVVQSKILKKFVEKRPFLLHITIARLKGGKSWDNNIPRRKDLNYTTYIQGIYIYESILKRSGAEYRKII